jgi:hypothetical protein
LYELIFEKIPWSVEGVESFDQLYKYVVIEKKRPTIPKDEGKYIFL